MSGHNETVIVTLDLMGLSRNGWAVKYEDADGNQGYLPISEVDFDGDFWGENREVEIPERLAIDRGLI